MYAVGTGKCPFVSVCICVKNINLLFKWLSVVLKQSFSTHFKKSTFFLILYAIFTMCSVHIFAYLLLDNFPSIGKLFIANNLLL